MKKMLTKNLGLKLLSLSCAFFVWLAVVNIANPTMLDSQEVIVEMINESVLEKNNLTYEIVGKKTTTVSYKIRTKDAYRVRASDFKAYADLSEMYDVTGAIPIKVEVLKNDELFVAAPTVKAPEVIKIKTEELQTKRFELYAHPQGIPSEGYVAGDVTMTPSFVYVKGPISLVGQISSVGIAFDIGGAAADVSGTEAAVFYDANGNALNLGESVRALSGEIAYTQQILKVKNLPLDFVVTGEVKAGYKHTGNECSVKNVPVAGLKSALAAISNITIQSPELSIEGATADRVVEIDLAQYMDPNVTIAGMENTRVQVTLKVEQLQDKTYAVDTKNITLTGKSDNFDYEVTEGKLDIKIQGLKEDLDSLSAAKMNISIDVTSMAAGTHEARLKLLLDDAYEARELPLCHVLVTVKPEEDMDGTSAAKSPEAIKPTETIKPADIVKNTDITNASEE